MATTAATAIASPATPPKVVNAVTASFTWSPNTPVAGQPVQFTDTSSGSPTLWCWNFGDSSGSTTQNPTHAYTAAGTYTVQLTANDGTGPTSITHSVVVVPLVTASFTWSPNTPTTGATVQFTDTSTGTPTFWCWFFGDGSVSTAQNPTHVYTLPGTYTVLEGAGNSGGSTSVTHSITVVQPVTASFTWSPPSPTAGQSVQFTDTSTGSPTFWCWTFGDGSGALGPNPTHVYATGGSYTVNLFAGNAGSGSSASLPIVIAAAPPPPPPPTASFTWSPPSPTTGQSVQFIDTSTGSPTFWCWTFGDGSGASVQNPSHVYTTAGTHTVQLLAGNAGGGTLASQPIVIAPGTPPATASFTWSPPSPRAGQTIQFADTSTGSPTFWCWNFGDGSGATVQNPSHVYTTAGTYTVQLLAGNAGGGSLATQSIVVTAATPSVTASFTWSPPSPTAGQTVQFTDTSTGSPTFWCWNFGDGSGSLAQNPSHAFATAGTYRVTLQAGNAGGSNILTESIVVAGATPSVAASFTWSPPSPTAGQTVQFTDTSTGSPTFWCWNFGDGSGSSAQNPSHAFATAGTYRVTLQAGNAGGSNILTESIVVAPSITASFTWSPASPAAGQSVSFTDTSTGSPTFWSWNFGDGSGSSSRNPSHVFATTGTYAVHLTAGSSTGSSTVTHNIVVGISCPAPFDLTSPANAATLDGTTLTVSLMWNSSSAATSYDVFFGTAPAPPFSGNTAQTQISMQVQPGATYYWLIVAKNACGSTKTSSGTWSFTVQPAPKADLTAAVTDVTPREAIAGETIGVTWSVTNQGAAAAPASALRLWLSSNRTVEPQADFLLSTETVPPIAANTSSSGTVTRTVPATLQSGPWFVLAEADSSGNVPESNEGNNVGYNSITVDPQRQPARVVASAYPSGMVQRANEATATDSYTLTNTGQTATTISLSQNGTFFQQSPGSFVLAAGESRVVSITASPQPAGLYDGASIPAGDGVPASLQIPIRLLSAAPPLEPPVVVPIESRVDVSAPPDQNPSGSVTFRNIGGTLFTGIAVSDVPWLLPSRDIVTIPPGESRDVGFTIDRANRPDVGALAGGVSGLLSLRYLGTAGSQKIGSLGTAPVPPVSVTVVDVVKTNTTAGTLPPLANGETAFFLPSLGAGTASFGDLLLSNRSTSGNPLDLRVYFTSGDSTQFISAVLPRNSSVAFPSIANTTFSAGLTAGTLQIRGAAREDVSVAAVQLVSTGAGTRTLYPPVLRSDLGAPAGQQIVLTAVEKSATTSTTLYLQEVAGTVAAIRIEYDDSEGRAITTRDPVPLAPFGSLEMRDAVPFDAVTTRITNRSTGAARIAAYAVVANSKTGDAIVITDSSRTAQPGATTQIIPLVTNPYATASSHSLFLTNNTATPADVSLQTGVPTVRRRVVATDLSPASGSAGTTILTIPPNKTISTDLTGSGYVTLTASAGAVAAAGRVQTQVSANTMTTALTVTPVSTAIRYGEKKMFLGINDSAQVTVAARASGTFRSSLMAVEAAGRRATLRVTLHFTFPAGGKVSGQASASKDFTIAPRQILNISDLGRAVIGPERDGYADFRDMSVEVEVVSGDGEIIPFIQSLDNGTGAVILRSE